MLNLTSTWQTKLELRTGFAPRNIKTQLSLCSIKHHTMKMYWGMEVELAYSSPTAIDKHQLHVQADLATGKKKIIRIGRKSAVGIASRYGLEVPGIESRSRRDRSCGPPNLLYTGYPVSFDRLHLPGCDVNHLSPSSAEVKEKVEVYLYAPSSGAVLGRLYVCFLLLS